MSNQTHLRTRIEAVAANAHLEPRLTLQGFPGGFSLFLDKQDFATIGETAITCKAAPLKTAEKLLGLDPKLMENTTTKWKVQYRKPEGWGDVKTVNEAGQIVDQHHDTIKATLENLEYFDQTNDRNTRIVPAGTPQETDLYAKEPATPEQNTTHAT